MNPEDLSELVEAQIESQGVSCLSATDGHVLTFTLELLERLVARARESGRVIVFVKTQVPS